jgi:hypothetical protein
MLQGRGELRALPPPTDFTATPPAAPTTSSRRKLSGEVASEDTVRKDKASASGSGQESPDNSPKAEPLRVLHQPPHEESNRYQLPPTIADLIQQTRYLKEASSRRVCRWSATAAHAEALGFHPETSW